MAADGLGSGNRLSLSKAAETAADLSNGAWVVRGGECKAANFEKGSGVTIDAGGLLHEISVNSAPFLSVEKLAQFGIRQNQIALQRLEKFAQPAAASRRLELR